MKSALGNDVRGYVQAAIIHGQGSYSRVGGATSRFVYELFSGEVIYVRTTSEGLGQTAAHQFHGSPCFLNMTRKPTARQPLDAMYTALKRSTGDSRDYA